MIPPEDRRRSIYDRLWTLDAAARPALSRGLSDPDVQIRRNVALFLGVAGGTCASDEAGLRTSACIGLRGIGPAARDALPALREALSDPHPDVRRFAHLAIEAIEK